MRQTIAIILWKKKGSASGEEIGNWSILKISMIFLSQPLISMSSGVYFIGKKDQILEEDYKKHICNARNTMILGCIFKYNLNVIN